MKKVLDWVGGKINDFTGETEREQLVSELKTLHKAYMSNITDIIDTTNNRIQNYNDTIRKLNGFRKNKVSLTISSLYHFLFKFGNVFQTKLFAAESGKEEIILPEKIFESKTKYIEDNDWEKKEYIKKILFKTVFGARMEIRKKNQVLRETLGQYRLEIVSTENQARLIQEKVATDIRISKMYESNIRMIDDVIEEKIIPELELIDAFMEAEAIKNVIIAKRELQNISVNRKITLLNGTLHEKHYRFIRNAFLFYQIGKKIYDTPVLTRLLHEETNERDLIELEKHTEALQEQSLMLNNASILEGQDGGASRDC
jgi:hypothetical protein